MKNVLFLCTGNYYRSRFAEILFNWTAAATHLPWRADSRGLALHAGNPGPISAHVRLFLERQAIHLTGPQRYPRPVSELDFQIAYLIVAIKEAEHRPLLEGQFPDWINRVEYWHVHDVEIWSPSEAQPVLAELVQDPSRRLAA